MKLNHMALGATAALSLHSLGCSLAATTLDEAEVSGQKTNPVVASSAPGAACTPAACTPVIPSDPLITDFQDVGPAGVFVDNDAFSAPNPEWWLNFYGSPYVFPNRAGGSASGLLQDTDGSWRVQGTVADWSGFGLWFGSCMVDLSAYKGISFSIWGDVGSSNELTLFAHTGPNSAPEACRTNVGSCDPNLGECRSPSVTMPVPSSPGTRTEILWSDFKGGSPLASPDRSQMIQFMWAFGWQDWAGTQSNPYPVDVTVDDIRLVP